MKTTIKFSCGLLPLGLGFFFHSRVLFAEPHSGYFDFQGLGCLPEGLVKSSYASDISDDGRVISGWSADLNSVSAVRWERVPSSGWGITPLTFGSQQATASVANGISGDGAVVVCHRYVSPEFQGYAWDATGEVADLNDAVLGSAGFLNSLSKAPSSNLSAIPKPTLLIPCDVSKDGSIVVGFVYYSGYRRFAFKWTHGTLLLLPPLESISPNTVLQGFSTATGLSQNGKVIVGTSTDALGQSVAVKWVNGKISPLTESGKVGYWGILTLCLPMAKLPSDNV